MRRYARLRGTLTVSLLLSAALLLFSTCRGDNDSGRPSPGIADAVGLAGTWSSGCLPDAQRDGFAYQDIRTFAGDSFSTSFTSFSDLECAKPVVIQEQMGRFVVGEPAEGDINELDITIAAIFVTLKTPGAVQSYNSSNFCGGGWQLDVRRQITRADCNSDSGQVSADLDMIFEIFAPRDGNLYFGRKDTGHNGRTKEQRPVSLDETKPFSRG